MSSDSDREILFTEASQANTDVCLCEEVPEASALQCARHLVSCD